MRITNTMEPSAVALVGLGLGLSVGCLSFRPNPEHCSNQDGDAMCAALYGDERPFCSWGRGGCESAPAEDGCIAARPTDACYSPCGGQSRFEDDESCLDASSSDSSGEDGSTDTTEGSTATTGSETSPLESSTGGMPCGGHDDCTDAAAPFCEPVTGECISCAATDDPDGACVGLDPGAPLCVEGACVQCTAENAAVCDEQRLLCDDATNTCVPCTGHDQCASGACELAVGQCFPAGDVLHVDGDGGADHSTVAAAIGAVANGAHGVIVIHQQDSGVSYPGATIDGGKIIALLGAPGELAIIQGIGVNPGLRVTGAGTSVYLEAVGISNSTGTGMFVDGALAWADRSSIVRNDGGGIVAQNGAELTLRNAFIGGDVNDQSAIAIDGSSATILYTTVGAGFGSALALACGAGAVVDARNSLFVARTDSNEIQCNGATIEHCATEIDLGGTNTYLGAMLTSWFVGFNLGDFHLTTAPVSIATTAQWETGDPPVDIDGDARPNTDGASDFAGADRP